MLIKIAGVPVTTKFGVIDALHATPHKGLDLALSEGSPLYAIGKGIVENVVDYGSQNIGKGVIVKLDNGMRIIYGHISQAKVSPGEHIEPGQLLALSGNTGRSTGAHLHLQVQDSSGKLIDPTPYAEKAIESSNSPLVPDFIEKPYDGFNQNLAELNDKLDTIGYWLNPKHVLEAAYHGLEQLITNPETALYLMGGTMVGIWLIAVGVRWPKKWVFWIWVAYFLLRVGVFG